MRQLPWKTFWVRLGSYPVARRFRIKLHQKDLNNALITGKELGVPLPVTALVQQMLGSLMNQGKGDHDHAAIANFIEDMAGITIAEG